MSCFLTICHYQLFHFEIQHRINKFPRALSLAHMIKLKKQKNPKTHPLLIMHLHPASVITQFLFICFFCSIDLQDFGVIPA